MRAKVKVSIFQGPLFLFVDDAAILILSVHTSDGCEWKGREREKRERLEPEQFGVSSYTEQDRVDKALLVFCQFLYSTPPSPPTTHPNTHPHPRPSSLY